LGFIEFIRKIKLGIVNLIYLRVYLVHANKRNYNSEIIVEDYSHWVGLKETEKKILNLLKYNLPHGIMLDIGVGAGRTTEYFSKIYERYFGIDYSQNMIEYCIKKFKGMPNVSFMVLDARNLSIFENDAFNFVLFSHGGLDSVEHGDRIMILKEIWRICKNGGYFCFSTSNLDAISQHCRVKFAKNPKFFVRMLVRLLLIRILNPEMWAYSRGEKNNLQHTMFNVGGHDWGLKTHCITYKEQLEQLKNSGFWNIKVFDEGGNQFSNLSYMKDFELYFLCNANKA